MEREAAAAGRRVALGGQVVLLHPKDRLSAIVLRGRDRAPALHLQVPLAITA